MHVHRPDKSTPPQLKRQRSPLQLGFTREKLMTNSSLPLPSANIPGGEGGGGGGQMGASVYTSQCYSLVLYCRMP